MNSPILDYLLTRRSAPIAELKEPAPTQDELHTILTAAARVPDHGMLEPWRFIVYRGEQRLHVGELLAELAEKRFGPLNEARKQQELTRFSRAPLVVGIVAVPQPSPKIPQWEMFLSGGAAAMNLMIAANAMGYGTNWITNWYSDDEDGRRLLGLSKDERVIGFVHIGTFGGSPADRPRPEINRIVSDYSGPTEE